MDKIIEVNNLKKNYGDLEAVKGIDFYVERGKLFAFLGPNGAGKSTTIDILCTLLEPNGGEIRIDGHKVGEEDAAIREIIGVVFQDNVLDKLLTVKENLTTRARFYGNKEVSAAVKYAAEAAGAAEFLDRRYGKLSGGQRRRADIARALVNTPKILFLDEPTTGLDPMTRKMVWETVASLQAESNMTVFLTTHYMEEAAQADYIIIIDKGEICAKGTPYELKEKYSTDTLRLKPSDFEKAKAVLEAAGAAPVVDGEVLVISLKNTKDALPLLKKAEKYIDTFEVVLGTMDDVFIKVTGSGAYD